ncbi:glycosyltransferase family 4 protein [Flavobacterium soyangense]|uniref:Glycosyltransferase family 4 protein n=1 Tax=Flavobacterium soyangense TaxID=2023265 RepID=A0A930U7L4_9FLAO|nr:glycosyltransferase family 4 protein [Flavobacterium soyangense]MBF2708388.1 glycosyltransferase family 4 protein [Flavobacterium soyangense]
MKILYIIPFIEGAGGVQRVLSMKTNYLVENFGYEIHILTQNGENKPLFYSFNDKIALHDMVLLGNKISFFLQYVKALKKALHTINPDLIIVCDNGLKGFTIPFILKTNIPIIFECHGSKYIEDKKKLKYFSTTKIKFVFKEFSANKFTKFIVLSSESLKEWSVKNAVVIPNPLWFQASRFADLKSKKVIIVARHSYEKGLDRMLQIWFKVVQKHPDWSLEIYGKSNENQELQKLANTLNISNSVCFFEPINDINGKYLEASIVVMTSRSEGFGMVLIEAMALGLPCVAFDCPCGPRTIIQNNKNGFLIEDGNIDSFVQKMELLIENENLRIQLGKNAQESVKIYDLDIIMQQWVSLFKNLVKE